MAKPLPPAAGLPGSSSSGESIAAGAAEPTVTYEAALGELERLVAAMEAGQLPLDHLLENYRRGTDLLALCRSRLEAVEEQVKVLEGGQLKPWGGSE